MGCEVAQFPFEALDIATAIENLPRLDLSSSEMQLECLPPSPYPPPLIDDRPPSPLPFFRSLLTASNDLALLTARLDDKKSAEITQ